MKRASLTVCMPFVSATFLMFVSMRALQVVERQTVTFDIEMSGRGNGEESM